MSTTHVTHAAAVAHVVTDSGSTTAVPALDVNLSTVLYENASYSHSSRHGWMTHAHGEENLFG